MTRIPRRAFVGSCVAGVAATLFSPKGVSCAMTRKPHVIVVGAGAFGGWTALTLQRRGFKVADDTRGPVFDPTAGERIATPVGLAAVRAYLGFRFPALRNAPLLEARVCQYEQSPDENFIVDRHPSADNVWLVGGGSGHGFKHGPAVGEIVAKAVLDAASPDPLFRLSRFAP